MIINVFFYDYTQPNEYIRIAEKSHRVPILGTQVHACVSAENRNAILEPLYDHIQKANYTTIGTSL